jgi:hypothetical protein
MAKAGTTPEELYGDHGGEVVSLGIGQWEMTLRGGVSAGKRDPSLDTNPETQTLCNPIYRRASTKIKAGSSMKSFQ